MTIKEIKRSLCYYDKRNPDTYFDEYNEPKTLKQQKNCYCDSCFRGNTELANELLKVKKELNNLKTT